jgi:hypothetical protein
MLFAGVASMRPCQCSNVYTLILILLLFAANYFFLPCLTFFSLFTDPEAPLFASLSSLLAILRRRDDRRSFCSPNHWLVREVNVLPEKNVFYFVFWKSNFSSNVLQWLFVIGRS